MSLYLTIYKFIDSVEYNDESYYDFNLEFYKDRAYDRLEKMYKNLPQYTNAMEQLKDKEYKSTISIRTTYCDRFNEFEFEGIIKIYV